MSDIIRDIIRAFLKIRPTCNSCHIRSAAVTVADYNWRMGDPEQLQALISRLDGRNVCAECGEVLLKLLDTVRSLRGDQQASSAHTGGLAVSG